MQEIWQLVLRKIIKILATICQILRLKCTKNFRWDSAAHPAGIAYSTHPDRLAGFKGPTSKGGVGKRGTCDGKGRGEEEWESEGTGREGREQGKGKDRKSVRANNYFTTTPLHISTNRLHSAIHAGL